MAAEPNRRLPLAGLTIAVVGAGRIGSELIRNLGLMGIGRIDVFERERHVADPLRSRYTVYDGDFWDTLTLAGLQGYDFAVCTVDSPTARQRMNQKCVVANANLVQVWTEGTLAIVRCLSFRRTAGFCVLRMRCVARRHSNADRRAQAVGGRNPGHGGTCHAHRNGECRGGIGRGPDRTYRGRCARLGSAPRHPRRNAGPGCLA